MERLSVLAFLAMAGCAAQTPMYISVCPVAPVYSESFEKSAAAQLKELPNNSPVVKLVEDYLSVRKEISECRNH